MAESRDQSLDGSRDESCRLIDPESVCDELELVDELDELLDGKLGEELCIPPPPIEDDDDDGGLEEMLGELEVVV